MPATQPRNDSETAWDYISQGLDRIMSDPHRLDRKSHISLYEAIYSICMERCAHKTSDEPVHRLHEDVYRRLDTYLKRHVREVRTAVMRVTGDDNALLKLFVIEWKRYTKAAQVNSNLFSILHRQWIKRFSLPDAEILRISPLHLKRWKEEMFADGTRNDFLNALLRLTEEQQKTQRVDEYQEIQSVANFLASLGELDTALNEKTELRSASLETLRMLEEVERHAKL